jgi:hypothetical protein
VGGWGNEKIAYADMPDASWRVFLFHFLPIVSFGWILMSLFR